MPRLATGSVTRAFSDPGWNTESAEFAAKCGLCGLCVLSVDRQGLVADASTAGIGTTNPPSFA
jgi:hypothetical protein